MTLTAVSLFAGIEGIGLALHRVGVEVTAAVEIDDAARGVIADRMPDTTLLTDVTEVSADDLRATGFDPDRGIVAAGWPCQGNSVAGRRGGMADPRSGLWVHVVRLLAELRPRWFLGENVPGLLSVNGGRDFAAVIGDLAGLGYGYAWRVLDAQHFGVPQRRRRVFVVGRVGDRVAPVQVLLEPECGGGDSAAGRAAGARVAATLTAGSHGPGSNAPGRRSEDDDNIVVSALTSNMAGGGGGADDNTAQGGHLIADTIRSHPRPGSNSNGAVVPFAVHENQRGEITTPDTVGALNTGGGKPGQGYPAVAYALRADPGGTGQGHNTNYVTALTAEGADGSEDGTGRGTPLVSYAIGSHAGSNGEVSNKSHGAGGPVGANISEELAYSLRAGREQSVASDTAVRRLTPLECERLQGFPDHWTATSNGKPQSDSARYRQLGNAVAVPCVEWIARRIMHADALTRASP